MDSHDPNLPGAPDLRPAEPAFPAPPPAPRAPAAPPPAAPPPAAAPPPPPDIPFDPVPVRPRRDGWTAEKQRLFIRALSETGIVREAAAAAGMSERSAHRLALRPDAAMFSDAWDAALRVATRRAVGAMFDYALDGLTETVWRNGEVVWQRRRPSIQALAFLLQRLDPVRFGRVPPRGAPDEPQPDEVRETLADFDLYLNALSDLAPEPDDEDEPGDEDEPAPDPGGGPGGRAGAGGDG